MFSSKANTYKLFNDESLTTDWKVCLEEKIKFFINIERVILLSPPPHHFKHFNQENVFLFGDR